MGTLFFIRDLPVCVVDRVSEAGSVHYGESEFDPLLLNVHGVFGDLHGLCDPFWTETGRSVLREREREELVEVRAAVPYLQH